MHKIKEKKEKSEISKKEERESETRDRSDTKEWSDHLSHSRIKSLMYPQVTLQPNGRL